MNPNLLSPKYFKKKVIGGKQYLPCFIFRPLGVTLFYSRKHYRTATETLERAKRIHERWIKLYKGMEDVAKTQSIQDT